MRSTLRWPIAVALVVVFVLLSRAQAERDVVGAQARKPFMMTRLYTGPDGQTHSEEIEAKFTAGGNSEVFKLLQVTGAELHRGSAGSVIDWHPGPRRQYVITLSGRGELEIAGGRRIPVEPGHIELIEDTTGKGHITRVLGGEDRVTLWLPLADQSSR
jgi:quercetin dioxygenase-like cupin family protein